MNNNLPVQNLPNIPLKEALLRLSVSPVKADREAITRIERETGKDIQKIIAELDSIDITLKVLDEKPTRKYGKFIRFAEWGLLFSSLVGIGALFLLPTDKLFFAIALGFLLGVSGAIRRY